MKRYKALASVAAGVLALGLFGQVAGAQTVVNERPELPIIAKVETEVTKQDLIKRFKVLYPEIAKKLKAENYEMTVGYQQANDEKIRYELDISKMDGNSFSSYYYGSVIFSEDLAVEQIYLSTPTTKDALYPAKYSEEQAHEVAEKFMSKMDITEYEMAPDFYGYGWNRLTDPIEYTFTYTKKHKGISLNDQYVIITVRGDGLITQFLQSDKKEGYTYDDPATVKNEKTMETRLKSKLSAQLQYQIMPTEYGAEAILVYRPTGQIQLGVHASTGEWVNDHGLTSSLTKNPKLKPIVEEALPAKRPDITKGEAKALVKELLTVDEKGVKLIIESVEETTTYTGRAVYSIEYMYEYMSGGMGASVSVDQQTGEVIAYTDTKSELLKELNGTKPETSISQAEAKQKAVEYIKEWVPSYAADYAMPTTEPWTFDEHESFYIIFPRVVNGLEVSGDQIAVQVGSDGSLLSLDVSQYDSVAWPLAEEIVSQKEATDVFKKSLDVSLQYLNFSQIENKRHYSLMYVPTFEGTMSAAIDAKTGEWLYTQGEDVPVEVDVETAELKYLIEKGMLKVDAETFDEYAAVSKEQALKMMVHALTYLSEEYVSMDEATESGDQLELYLQAAKEAGILVGDETFKADEVLTREEFAKWAIQTLKLQYAAQFSDIYQLSFSDTNQIKPEYRGYVALANAMGILDSNGQVQPKKAVSYAELAQSIVRLAYKVNEYEVSTY